MTLALNDAIVVPKKRKALLPVLSVLFLICYGLLSMLVVEQGRTIESQRGLIRDLFNDSTELSAMKAKELLRERAMAERGSKPEAQTTVPQLQVLPHHRARNKDAVRSQTPTLQKPPKPAADADDARRIPLTI